MRLGGRLKHAREKRGLKQEQLAELASAIAGKTISQASISALEKRNSATTEHVFALAKVLRVNPEWLQTGEPANDSGLETDGWSPPSAELSADEADLLRDYRNATEAWRWTVRLFARTPPADQQQLSRDMNILMTTIFGKAVPDDRLSDKWRRPDQPMTPKEKP